MTFERFASIAVLLALAAGCGDLSRGPGDGTGGGAVPGFAADVHPILMGHCAGCHKPSNRKFALTGDASKDYTTVGTKIVVGDSAASLLYQKATGAVSHGGGTQLPASGVEATTVADWIDGGAPP